MKHYKFLSALLLSMAGGIASAQNPIINTQFTADPTARVFNGKIYVYPSHDIISPVEPERKWFCMEDYHVYSSEDLVEWTDHGMILSQDDVPWVKPKSYSMWAPDCVEKDGRYYFYFPSTPTSGRGFGIGVAIGNSPEGPFRPMWRPIEGVFGIDPGILIDDDGQAYMYWGGVQQAKLKDNMMELATKPEFVNDLPKKGLKEGPFPFKRNGKYYLTFPWAKDSTEVLAYCMADKPLGPWEFKGVFMDESPTGCWTNHHSIVEYKGQWYIFYHHNDYSPEFDKNRSARIDTIGFNPDGTIKKVIPTLRGVGNSKARTHIQIDRYSEIAPTASIAYLNEANKFEGWKTQFNKSGAWVRYNRVEFGQEPVKQVKVRVLAPKGATLETIKNVYSHPQGFSQCSDFLEDKKNWSHIDSISTATGAETVANKNSVENAAIANYRNAKLYGLEVLAEGIENNPNNYTRFLIIAANHIAEKNEFVTKTADKAKILLNFIIIYSIMFYLISFFIYEIQCISINI